MTTRGSARFPQAVSWYNGGVERSDLYEDDLTEEREPTPEQRDVVAGEETLDPDEPVPDDRLPWPDVPVTGAPPPSDAMPSPTVYADEALNDPTLPRVPGTSAGPP
jgi:hypothetical protein